VLPFYQARAGLEFALEMGVERLRSYSLIQQVDLAGRFTEEGIAILGAHQPRGAFIAIPSSKATAAAAQLLARGVVADARGDLLRLCPDILNTSQELAEAASCIVNVLRSF